MRSSSNAWFVLDRIRIGLVRGFIRFKSIWRLLTEVKVFPVPGGPWIMLTGFPRMWATA